MPRLIDADALTSVLEQWEEEAIDGTENDGSDGTTRVLLPVPTTTREMIDLIAAQQTIVAEPRQYGRWENRRACHNKGGVRYRCSCCGSDAAAARFRYCPDCGAYME